MGVRGRGFKTRDQFSSKFSEHPQLEMLQDMRDSMVAGFLPDEVFAIVGNTKTQFTPDPDVTHVGVSVEVDSFHIRTGDREESLPFTGQASQDQMLLADHGYSSGSGPFTWASTADLPNGLVSGVLYWLESTGTGSVKVHTSRRSALTSGADLAVLTSNGTGTITLNGTGDDDFPAEAGATDLVNGHYPFTLTAANQQGNSAAMPAFIVFQARPFMVSGLTGGARMKIAVVR